MPIQDRPEGGIKADEDGLIEHFGYLASRELSGKFAD